MRRCVCAVIPVVLCTLACARSTRGQAATRPAAATRVSTAPASRPADPRWRNLPHTDTRFEPKSYESRLVWESRAAYLRRQILWAAGLLPTPEKTPLNPQIFGRLERDGYTVEKVYFESLPGFYVTGNLYRPKDTRGRHPGVACPHGHWARGRLQDDELGSVPARCITLARLGCVVFSYDMVGYNDSGKQISNHRFGSERASLWGLSPLGVQLWNSIRVVDFLCSLPDVDPDRIGCTGASGGGTQTFLLSAVDDRVKVAAPVNMISCSMQGGCVCENAPGLRFDTNNMEIGAMMAPRPLLLVSATGDWTRNTPNVEYPAIRDVYRLYEAQDKVETVQIDAPHNYNRASREAVYRWFGRHLLGRTDMEAYTEPPYPKERDEDLLVWAGRPLPEDAIRDVETLTARWIEAARRQNDARRPDRTAQWATVAQEIGGWLAVATGAPVSRLRSSGYRWEERATLSAGLIVSRGVVTEDRRGLRIPAVYFALPPRMDTRPAGGVACTVLAPAEGTQVLFEADGQTPNALVRSLTTGGNRLLAIDAFGIGKAVGPQDAAQPRGTTKFFTTFNRTDAAEQVCDVVAAAVFCLDYRFAPGAFSSVNIVGTGRTGPAVLVAGAILAAARPDAERLRVVVDANGFDTSSEDAYLKQFYVPGILRAGGLPAAAAAIHPARLLLHNTGGRFDTSWVELAARFGRPNAVKISPERLGDDQIVAWLMQK